MKRPLEIRPVREDDLRPLYLLGREFFKNQDPLFMPAWNESNLADVIARGRDLALVAIAKKKPVGFLIASLEETDGHTEAVIRWLCADESKNPGLYAGLLAAFTDTLSGRTIKKITIALPETNAELIDYFRNNGFTDSKHFIIMENFLHSHG